MKKIQKKYKLTPKKLNTYKKYILYVISGIILITMLICKEIEYQLFCLGLIMFLEILLKNKKYNQ